MPTVVSRGRVVLLLTVASTLVVRLSCQLCGAATVSAAWVKVSVMVEVCP